MKNTLYPSFKILMVDDEAVFLRSLGFSLERYAGIDNVKHCTDSRLAMDELATGQYAVVLLDLNMPHLSGEDLLEKIVESHPHIAVIIISGIGQIERAVQCIKTGAYDYYVKTDEPERLIGGIKRVVRFQELNIENQAMREYMLENTSPDQDAFSHIITNDPRMRSVFQYILSVARSKQPILITGESGVGKELIAQAIHDSSARSDALVCVNVAGLDDHLFADTLFGHKRGAFTGADSNRAGMIEQAGSGTLFLDEIGDLSMASQVKLLRLLQEGEYYPIGSDKPKRIQARIIAATHQDLNKKQRSGDFRNDLYYRLKVHHVDIPPLRQRKEDVGLLLDFFLEEAARELGKVKPNVPRELAVLLSNYAFPGNIRELRAMTYDALSVHQSRTLSMSVFKQSMDGMAGALPDESQLNGEREIFIADQPLPTLKEISILLIKESMKRAHGNQSTAARLLGISQPALSKRLKKSAEESDSEEG
ncbi:MAG: sigma-54 dependent transcriptional regulator [Bermanella sp.]